MALLLFVYKHCPPQPLIKPLSEAEYTPAPARCLFSPARSPHYRHFDVNLRYRESVEYHSIASGLFILSGHFHHARCALAILDDDDARYT